MMARDVSEDQIAAATRVFKTFLRGHGLKFTPERERILRATFATDAHFEAEQLLLLTGQRANRVGKATVYRTLKLLVGCNIVSQVHLGNKQVCYELVYGQAMHDHMVCTRCGRVIEFEVSEVERIRDRVASNFDFHAAEHRFQILGTCERCVGSCPVEPAPMASRKDLLISRARGR